MCLSLMIIIIVAIKHTLYQYGFSPVLPEYVWYSMLLGTVLNVLVKNYISTIFKYTGYESYCLMNHDYH